MIETQINWFNLKKTVGKESVKFIGNMLQVWLDQVALK